MTLCDPQRVAQVLDHPQTAPGDLETLCEAVDAALLPLLTDGVDHAPHANCQEAAVGIAVQVWQSRHAPGGQMLGVDMGLIQSPHLLGPGLVTRFTGLLAPCMDHAGAVVA